MPYYFDLSRDSTSNATPLTATSHLFVQTAANQEPVLIGNIYVSARSGTAGGGTLIVKSNTGVAASGGTAQTPLGKDMRLGVALQSTWKSDASAVTAGGTLVQRLGIGFAQTGGMGGWVPLDPDEKFRLMPNATNPVDLELNSLCASASVPMSWTVGFSEG